MTNQGRAAAQAGFTLVEVMVVLLIFMIIAGAVFAAISAAQVRYRAEKQFLDSFQGARIGVDLMARDIHNAGYPSPYTYPGNFSKLPTGPTPLLIPDPVPWPDPAKTDTPLDASVALQQRFAVGIVGVRAGVVDLTCTVNGGTKPCDPDGPGGVVGVPNAFDLILELDIDPEANNPALGPPTIEWVRYQLCWIQPDGTCDPDKKSPNAWPAGRQHSTLVRAVAVKDAVSDPSVIAVSNVPFVENIVQDSTINVGPVPGLPDGTRNTAVFTYICAGGAASCTVEEVESVIINLRVRSAEADLQTQQAREITLRGLARRLNPSR